MSFTVLIPARMHSTRLPEKPLKDIEGKPMIVRVVEAAKKSGAKSVAVATDHPKIIDVCDSFGISAVLTSSEHTTGTDRLAQAADLLGLPDDEIVVNLQGDEPLMPPEVICKVATTLQASPGAVMSTAAHTLRSVEDFKNPNVVKVVVDSQSSALLFSRAPIPWPRDAFKNNANQLPNGFSALHHLGIYAYRTNFLKTYPTLKKSDLETFESLEQLRVLYHGYKIAVVQLESNLPAGVDTPEDLKRVIEFVRTHREQFE